MIGIDLGTTHSLVAYWEEEASEAKVIPNILGEMITPSVVSILNKEEFLVGRAAKTRLFTHPKNSASTFKRKMGSLSKYNLGSHRLTAIELSSLVLAQMKSDAEAYLGRPVSEAVISVPAYFNDAQRQATKLAAEMAELKVSRLINEPTAAAIAYGLHEKMDDSNFLVVDLGGGTLDVSLLEIFDDIIEVHASAGDNFLGGEDFTQLILEDFCDRQKLNFDQLSVEAKSALYDSLNQLKESLTVEHVKSIELTLDGKTYQYQLSRDEFEKIVAPLLQRIRTPIERVIRDSSLNLSDISDVVLVGGATRMPCVRRLIGTLLRRLPSTHIDPDKVIAMGAAIQGALHQRSDALKDIILTDICPYSLGVEVVVEKAKGRMESGHFLPIIERNTTIPTSRVETLSSVYDDQKIIRCHIFQGESRLTRNNIKLGTIEIDIRPAKAGEESIDIRFTYNSNGILEVIAHSASSNLESRLIINNSSGNMSEEEIQQSLNKLASLKIHPREDYPNTHVMAQLEKLYEESLGEKRDYIAYLVRQFEAILEQQDHDLAKRHREQLQPEIERLIKEGEVL